MQQVINYIEVTPRTSLKFEYRNYLKYLEKLRKKTGNLHNYFFPK